MDGLAEQEMSNSERITNFSPVDATVFSGLHLLAERSSDKYRMSLAKQEMSNSAGITNVFLRWM